VVQELVVTSVPKGLKAGARGFAMVACTKGMSATLVQLCEALSGYSHVFPLNDPRYEQNPPCFSHYIFMSGGEESHIVSRVAAYKADYTGRTNKLAHHLVFRREELSSGGPAAVASEPGLLLTKWDSEPGYFLEDRVKIPHLDDKPMQPCGNWQQTFGDASAAGWLAQGFIENPERPSWIIFEPGMPVLSLITEALSLLPPPKRWQVTFSTYFSRLPVGSTCVWRCCLPDSEGLKVARRTPGALVFDLTTRTVSGQKPDNLKLAEYAVGNGMPPWAEEQKPQAAPVHKQPGSSSRRRTPARRIQSTRSGGARKVTTRRPKLSDYSEALKPAPPARKKEWGFYGLLEKRGRQAVVLQ